MLVLRDPSAASSITDPVLRSLVDQRFIDISAGDNYDCDIHGFMLVVEPNDAVDSVEQECGCSILGSPFGPAHFGDPDFVPTFEVLEEHSSFYEMVFVPSDGDFGTVIFVPKTEGIDSDLLAICAQYAVPAPELMSP